MTKVWRVVWLGFLAAVGAGLAFLVWMKVKARFSKRETDEKLLGRQPGLVGGLLDKVGGFFGARNRPTAAPPMNSGYGAVGTPTYKRGEGYSMVPLDANVPSFLEGATGGHIDDQQTGTAPPERLGPPPICGVGWLSASAQQQVRPNVISAAYLNKNRAN